MRKPALPSSTELMRHDFGDVNVDGGGVTLQHVFTYTDALAIPDEVLQLKSTCGCTTVEAVTAVLEPGETLDIPVRFDVKRVGKLQSEVWLFLKEARLQTFNLSAAGVHSTHMVMVQQHVAPDAGGVATLNLVGLQLNDRAPDVPTIEAKGLNVIVSEWNRIHGGDPLPPVPARWHATVHITRALDAPEIVSEIVVRLPDREIGRATIRW